MAQTDDPTKVQELSRVVRLLKRFRKNELSSRRLRLRHQQDRLNRTRRKRKLQVDHNVGQFDPVKFIAELAAKRTEVDDLGPENRMLLAKYIDSRLTEIVDDIMKKIGLLANSTSVTPQQVSAPQPAQPPWPPGPQFFNLGSPFDPKRPYPSSRNRPEDR